MSLIQIPTTDDAEAEVLDDIRKMWLSMQSHIQHQPHPWSGFLRRSAQARGIRGSNSIEGYDVTDDDALAAVDEAEPFREQDETWRAVKGYRDAMTYALRVGGDPHATIDASLIRSLHYMMMSYDPSKDPGLWRGGYMRVTDDQGATAYEAPDHERVPELMAELIEWIGSEDTQTGAILRGALAHLNIVKIHPFRDGNGRMARCLQTLILAKSGVFDAVFASVEEHLRTVQAEYYEVLTGMDSGIWNPDADARPWLRFMLRAHYVQATVFIRRRIELADVWTEIEELLKTAGLSDRSAPALVEATFGFRIRNSRYRASADVSPGLASRDLKALVEAGLLVAQGERRGRYYTRAETLEIIRRRRRQPRVVRDPFDDAGR